MTSKHRNLTELLLDLVEDKTSSVCGWQICRKCVMLPRQYGPKDLRNVSSTLLILCPEELRKFWGKFFFAFIFWPFFYTFLDSVGFSHFLDFLFDLSRSCLLGPKLLLYIPYIQLWHLNQEFFFKAHLLMNFAAFISDEREIRNSVLSKKKLMFFLRVKKKKVMG